MPRRIVSVTLAWVLSPLVPALCYADSAVWSVTNGGSMMYLAGTMHKLSPAQYPLPDEYRDVYERADIVVFETDIGAMQSPAVQRRLAERSKLEENQTLESILDPSTYKALRQYCEQTAFPIEYLEPLKPAAAMLTLLSVTLQSLGVTAPGVDEHFYQRALSDSKEIHALESVKDQIEHLISLDQGNPDQFVRHSIEDLKEARRGALEQGLRIWREGEEGPLVEHFLRDQMQYSPELYQSLLVDRNEQWARHLEKYAATPQTELVLVGVAHLVGERGLVKLLEDAGFRIEKHSVR